MVAMVGHQLRCGEVFDVGNPLGGVWLISARSVHDGLPEEKSWERQYKSDRLTCPDRIQNLYYSVHFLPSYSPELNLIEILRRFIKYYWLPFSAYGSFQPLCAAVEEILQQFGTRY